MSGTQAISYEEVYKEYFEIIERKAKCRLHRTLTKESEKWQEIEGYVRR